MDPSILDAVESGFQQIADQLTHLRQHWLDSEQSLRSSRQEDDQDNVDDCAASLLECSPLETLTRLRRLESEWAELKQRHATLARNKAVFSPQVPSAHHVMVLSLLLPPYYCDYYNLSPPQSWSSQVQSSLMEQQALLKRLKEATEVDVRYAQNAGFMFAHTNTHHSTTHSLTLTPTDLAGDQRLHASVRVAIASPPVVVNHSIS